MSNDSDTQDIDVLNAVVAALERLNPDDRKRVIRTVSTFFNVDDSGEKQSRRQSVKELSPLNTTAPTVPYSEDLAQSPKAFLFEKQPRTDVERIACLAYYLTHYRNSPYFKTLELSKLNTEAAQPKFTNAAYTTNNAQKMGYLVSATGNRRQLSAGSEQFVQALPDRELAKKVMANFRPRKRKKRNKVRNQN